MRAIICERPFNLEILDRPEPQAGPSEVLVRIRRVGLCGTDYHIFQGNQPFLEYPRVMGHELAGQIISAPAGSPFKDGQTVTINPYLACGSCIACRKAKPNCCRQIAVLGVHTDGGMCDIIAVPESAVIDATGLSLDQAAMVEFLAIGAHAVARARLAADACVLVVGAGPIGLAAALFAGLDGANVTLIDTQQSRLDHARDSLGIANVLLADAGAYAVLQHQTGGEFFDCVFDATGAIKAMRAGLEYVGHGGTYVLISVVKDDLQFPDPEFHKRETTLLASRNALSSDFARVISAIKAGDIPTEKLHTHSLQALDLPTRLPELVANNSGLIKAIVQF